MAAIIAQITREARERKIRIKKTLPIKKSNYNLPPFKDTFRPYRDNQVNLQIIMIDSPILNKFLVFEKKTSCSIQSQNWRTISRIKGRRWPSLQLNTSVQMSNFQRCCHYYYFTVFCTHFDISNWAFLANVIPDCRHNHNNKVWSWGKTIEHWWKIVPYVHSQSFGRCRFRVCWPVVAL